MILLVRVLLDNDEVQKAGEEIGKLILMLQEEKVDDLAKEFFLLGIIEWCKGHLEDAQKRMIDYVIANRDDHDKIFSNVAEFKSLLLRNGVTQVEYAMMLNLMDNHFPAE